MCGLISAPTACGETSIAASAANAGRSPAIRPAVAQAEARRRCRRFIWYAMLSSARGEGGEYGQAARTPAGIDTGAALGHVRSAPVRYAGLMVKFLIGLVTGVALVFLSLILLFVIALRFREGAPAIASNSVLV